MGNNKVTSNIGYFGHTSLFLILANQIQLYQMVIFFMHD